MWWCFFDIWVSCQFQMPLTIALNRQQIIQCAVHLNTVQIILVNLFQTP